jgi:hypothetical protein
VGRRLLESGAGCSFVGATRGPRVGRYAVYGDVDDALADLDAIEQLHKDEMIGKFDAAVLDKTDGEPHIVKRMDRPFVRVIPEWLGAGTLPRHDLRDAAEALDASEAALIVVGDPTIEKGVEKAVTRANQEG